jgi:hypothetical protein
MSGDRVRAIIANAQEVTPELPRPLMRELPPADPFPVDVLGDVLAPAARAINDRVQAPPAICGQAVLSAATLAVQAHADVQLPTGQRKPLSNYYITIAESGERKSTCDAEALWPILKREKTLRELYAADLISYTNDKIAWDKARDFEIKRAKGNRERIKAALDMLGPLPASPLDPLLICPEPTFEGLCKLFAIGSPSLGIFSSEGGQFIGGHGMTDENKLRTATGLSSVWDGEPIRRVRAGDGVSFLPGRRLSIHLMIQPDVASILLNDRLLTSQGLLSRTLITSPDTAAGTRKWREADPASDAALRRYGARLLSSLEAPLPLACGKLNELQPRALAMSSESRKIWIAFSDYVEAAIAPNGPLESVRGLANKLPEHAARVAAVLTLVGDFHATEITADNMKAGIALAEHYASEALRVLGAARVNADLRLAKRLLEWLLNQWTEPLISLPDIYQRSLNAISDQATARKVVTLLEGHGWLVNLPEGAIVNGQRRREAWRIVRQV